MWLLGEVHNKREQIEVWRKNGACGIFVTLQGRKIFLKFFKHLKLFKKNYFKSAGICDK